MTDEVWLIAPRDRSELHATVTDAAKSRGYAPIVRHGEPKVLDKRPVTVLTLREAAELWAHANQHVVAVGHAGDVVVNGRPDRTVTGPSAIPLAHFLMGRAVVRRLPASSEYGRELQSSLDALFEDLRDWGALPGFEDEADPRCLPLYVHSPAGCHHDLRTLAGRTTFGVQYGHHSRSDDLGRVWTRARPEGRRLVRVGGGFLSEGMHWDVKNGRHGKARIATVSEVWSVEPDGYVNVYPDAFIRGPQRDSRGAKKIYPSR